MKYSIVRQLANSAKITGLLLLLMTLSFCSEDSTDTSIIDEDEEEIEGEPTVYDNSTSIPLGGNAFQTAGSSFLNIAVEGVTFWDSPSTEFSAFVYSDADMTIRLDIKITTQTGNSTISVASNGQTHQTDIPDGKSGLVGIGEFDIKKGYNEFAFKGTQKASTDYADIVDLVINYNGALQLNYILNNEGENFLWGRRGPSVHMNYTAPNDTDYEWFYNEMTIPTGQDVIGSYFMANGFNEGYFGIQVNSDTERKVLFSVWSPFDTEDPEDIPEESKIKLIKKGESVSVGEFGNEGAGGQSYMIYDWQPDVAYKFLNSVTPDGLGNTIYTAYFMDPSVGTWMLLASFLRPQTDTWYLGQYSFLENFEPTQGHIGRLVQFDNQWMFDTNGNAVELTSAIFTGDNVASISYRLDFSGGIQNNAFFLKNGGFFNGDVALNSQFSRNANGQAPTIDFNSLP